MNIEIASLIATLSVGSLLVLQIIFPKRKTKPNTR
jgi:hypothetical protein